MRGDILGGLAGPDLATQGLPNVASYVRPYCEGTGRSGVPELKFCVVLSLFRLAAILHGIHRRVARGTPASVHAQEMGAKLERVAALVFGRRCWAAPFRHEARAESPYP